MIAPLLKFEVPISLRYLNTDIPVNDPRFAMVGRAMWHAVDLDKTEEALWAGLSGSARQNTCTGAERDGVVVRESRDLEAVRAFHRLHCYLRKIKYRLLAQPIAFFENLHEAFAPSEQLTVLLAEIDEIPVAGTSSPRMEGRPLLQVQCLLRPAIAPERSTCLGRDPPRSPTRAGTHGLRPLRPRPAGADPV